MATINAKERLFHDRWAAGIDPAEILVEESFTAATCPENRIIRRWLGDLKGRRILDLGAGAGEAAVYFAKEGGRVAAADISGEMLEVVRRVGELHGVEVETRRSSAEDIDFPDDTFDIIYAGNLLHHVNIEKALKEVHRTLKKGGVAVFWDPIAHNPLIKIYRWLARGVRTEDEHPLRFKELKIFRERFSEFEYTTTWFFALWIFIKFFLLEHKDPSRYRYWKLIVKDHKRLSGLYRRLERLDERVLNAFPFLKRYCWNIIIRCVK